jgi:hypothetical protein
MTNSNLGRCSSCKSWSRFVHVFNEKGAPDLKIGTCSKLDNDNDVTYYDGVDTANEKVKEGLIGCENLYVHENFGCIHYSCNGIE